MPKSMAYRVNLTYVNAAVALFLMCFCPITSLRHRVAQCEVLRPCVCEFPTADGIDLSVLSNQTLRANLPANVTVYFRPCDTLNDSSVPTQCGTTSLCLFKNSTTLNKTVVLGNVGDLQFLSENVVQPVQLQFVHDNILSTIELSCDENDNKTSFTGKAENPLQYHFVLKSPAACVRPLENHYGRSMISVLLISSLIIACTYFAAMIILRYSRGAVGWEVLPHYELFTNLPGLCRSGCTKLLICCRLRPSYQEI